MQPTETGSDDNDFDDDGDFQSPARYNYSSDDFPSLTSIATYCFAIHSIPRLALYALTESSSSSSKVSWRKLGQKLGTTPTGNLLLGSLTCVGAFGMGCWQLEKISDDWTATDDCYNQLRLDPLPYGPDHQQVAAAALKPRDVRQPVGDTTHRDGLDDRLHKMLGEGQQPYRRRCIRGRFHHDKEVLIGPRSAPHGIQTGGQGFCVLAPLEVEAAAPVLRHASTASLPSTSSHSHVVWINRGWIPKTLLPKWTDRPHYYENDPVESARINRLLKDWPTAWNRPEGIVELTAVPLKAEEPTMFLTPKHDFLTRPLQMFWIDGRSLKSIAGSDLYTTCKLTSDTTDVALFTQVMDEQNEKGKEYEHHDESICYPLLQPVSSIGKSDTTYLYTRMGYAASWFALSGASWHMARKLFTMGRL